VKCLLKYQWVKLPRNQLPQGKGVLGYWAKLAARAAFRKGTACYCGYKNEVTPGMWSGGVVGLKSILGVRSRMLALQIMDKLQQLGYLTYSLDAQTKRLEYRITNWVARCAGQECESGAVYATTGYGFVCIPRSIPQRLVHLNYRFEEADALLDLWCHTTWNDPRNAFSFLAPTIQLDSYNAVLTLEKLGERWGWEKTKVWRFFQKHSSVFALHRLPGSFGCLIFHCQYPTGQEILRPKQAEIDCILTKIRNLSAGTPVAGSDNTRLCKLVLWFSRKLKLPELPATLPTEFGRVAVSTLIKRAYFSLCWNCKNCVYDCGVCNITAGNAEQPGNPHHPSRSQDKKEQNHEKATNHRADCK